MFAQWEKDYFENSNHEIPIIIPGKPVSLVKITRLETFILHVPVTRDGIADSTHALTHWGAPGVIIHTDAGISGYGYTGTHAHLASDKLITSCIRDCYGPLLVGFDPLETRHLWNKLAHHPPLQWVGRGGITHLALAAVDVALWDIKAKAAGLPLWKLLGGSEEKRVEGYNTDGGWLNWSDEVLVTDCRRLVEEGGYRGIKIKVGSVDITRDLRRVEAVRNAIGPHIKFMVDANGHWDLPTAMRFGKAISAFDIYWFEEPLWYDDVAGHARLARSIDTPIALGEQLYLLDHFKGFMDAGALHFAQPDAVRLAGITEWLEAADLAHAHRLPVCAHVGDMVHIHLPLSIAHPACTMLEYIPWLRDCFTEPATVHEGYFVIPQEAGANTTLRPDKLETFGVK